MLGYDIQSRSDISLLGIIVDRGENAGQLLAFGGIDIGTPDFKKQDRAISIAAIPSFMFETVVENQ